MNITYMTRLARIVMPLSALIISLSASALEVNTSSPGQLAANVGSVPGEVTTLTINGPIDASDFDFINSRLTDLVALDLSKTSISAYSGDAVLLNRNDFAANVLPDYALAGMRIKSIKLPSGLVAIGEGAMSSTALESLDLSGLSSLRSIGMGAFSNCDALTEVVIPATVTEMGACSFSRCDNLETVSVMASVDLPREAFAYCPKLSSVTLGGQTKVLGTGAFSYCTALTGITLPASLTEVGQGCFEGSGLVTVDMSATAARTLGSWAFAKCPALTEVVMSASTTSLGEGIFFEDTALRRVALPAGVTEIPDYCFKGDSAVDTAAFVHPSITYIGHYALKDMSHVTHFTLPADVAYIGDEAMAGWTSLRSLKVPEGCSEVPELGSQVWDGVDQSAVDLYVVRDMAALFESADQWREFHISGYTGIDDVAVDPASSAASLRAWFEGTDLHLSAAVGLGSVQLYDLSGRCVVSAMAGADTTFVIDTEGLATRVYLLRLTLDDGTPASAKLVR